MVTSDSIPFLTNHNKVAPSRVRKRQLYINVRPPGYVGDLRATKYASKYNKKRGAERSKMVGNRHAVLRQNYRHKQIPIEHQGYLEYAGFVKESGAPELGLCCKY